MVKPWKKSIKEAEDGGYYIPSGTPIEVNLQDRLSYWESTTIQAINRKTTEYQPSGRFKQEDERSSSSSSSSVKSDSNDDNEEDDDDKKAEHETNRR